MLESVLLFCAFHGIIKCYSDIFLFSEKGKGKSCNKSAVLGVIFGSRLFFRC